MSNEIKELIKEMKEYRDGMVVRNLPFQWISDIITKWEMKQVPKLDFLEETEKEKTLFYVWITEQKHNQKCYLEKH